MIEQSRIESWIRVSRLDVLKLECERLNCLTGDWREWAVEGGPMTGNWQFMSSLSSQVA